VVVLSTLGAPERRFLSGRRARAVDPEPGPEPVPTARATVIGVGRPLTAADAPSWLKGLGRDGQAAAVADALGVLNRVLHAHRLAAADPYVRDAGAESALAVRIGYGSGEEVADGRWSEALQVPPASRRRGRRSAALRPQERLAALLGACDRPLACEELVLRARADLDAGRTREAALQLRVALEAGIAELASAPTGAADMPERVAELREHRGAVGDAANAALAGDLGAEQRSAVEQALGRLEAALRARSAAGLDQGSA
jgi:hypothetical protein